MAERSPERTGRRICIVIPVSGARASGNRRTAEHWAKTLRGLGHEVMIAEGVTSFEGEVLVVLHAVKCREALVAYRERMPAGKVVLCLSGTDIYGPPRAELGDSMREADRLVVLQRKALERIPEEHRDKARVIVQGVERFSGEVSEQGGFTVCVVGHLRDVKDPMRAAEAVRALPGESQLCVVQAGAVLDDSYRGRIEQEMEASPRYHWLGELSPEETRALIAGSKALVLTSRSEGGARVIGEAVVNGVPVLATRIDGVVGLLGDDYGGYFEVGDTDGLRALLLRFEQDEEFREALRKQVGQLAGQFDPSREEASWAALLAEID